MKIRVKVRFFTTLRELLGKREEQMEFPQAGTVEELLKQLSQKYGKRFRDYIYDDKGEVRSHLHFLINGQSTTTLQGFKTRLKEGDQVAILPPVGGG